MAIGAVVVGAIGIIQSQSQSRKAAQRSRNDAYYNAQQEAKVTAEEVRRLEKSAAQTEGLAKARAAAGGGGGASQENYITQLEKTHTEEVDWLKEVGAYAYESHIRSGENAASQARAAGNRATIGHIGGMMGGYSQYQKYGF